MKAPEKPCISASDLARQSRYSLEVCERLLRAIGTSQVDPRAVLDMADRHNVSPSVALHLIGST